MSDSNIFTGETKNTVWTLYIGTLLVFSAISAFVVYPKDKLFEEK